METLGAFFLPVRVLHKFKVITLVAPLPDLIADNETHKHPVEQTWLNKHPRIHLHLMPNSASWLNMVKRFFRDITIRHIHHGKAWAALEPDCLLIDGRALLST